MRTLALYNIKGGVGKTASAVNLATVCAAGGQRTLLWDLDPQGAATYYFRVRPKVAGGGRALIRGDLDLGQLVKGSDFPGLDVLPADFSYRKFEGELASLDDPLRQLQRLAEPLAADYDYLFVDCPPTVTRIADSIFQAADALVVPTIPTTLSLRTLAQLMKHLKRRPKPRPLALPFFSMVDRRKSLHRNVCAWVEQQGLGFLKAQIPFASSIEKMGLHRNPLLAFEPGGAPARAYAALWDEIAARLDSDARTRPRLFDKPTRRALEQLGRTGPPSNGRPTPR